MHQLLLFCVLCHFILEYFVCRTVVLMMQCIKTRGDCPAKGISRIQTLRWLRSESATLCRFTDWSSVSMDFNGAAENRNKKVCWRLWEWMEQCAGLNTELLHDDWRISLRLNPLLISYLQFNIVFICSMYVWCYRLKNEPHLFDAFRIKDFTAMLVVLSRARLIHWPADYS